MSLEIKEKIKNIFLQQNNLWNNDIKKLNNATDAVISHILKFNLSIIDVKNKLVGFENGLILISSDSRQIFLKIVDKKYLYVRNSETNTSNILQNFASVYFYLSYKVNNNFITTASFQISEKFENLTNLIELYSLKTILNKPNICKSIIKIMIKSLIFNYFDLKPENIVIDLKTYKGYLVDFSVNEFWKVKTERNFKKLFPYNIDNLDINNNFKAIKIGNYEFFNSDNVYRFLIEILCLGQSKKEWIEDTNTHGCPFYKKEDSKTASMYEILNFILLNKSSEKYIKKYFIYAYLALIKRKIYIIKNNIKGKELKYCKIGIIRIKKINALIKNHSLEHCYLNNF